MNILFFFQKTWELTFLMFPQTVWENVELWMGKGSLFSNIFTINKKPLTMTYQNSYVAAKAT